MTIPEPRNTFVGEIGVGRRSAIGTDAAWMLLHGKRSGILHPYAGPWRQDNTTVQRREGATEMYLYGYRIAIRGPAWDTLLISLANHPTRTTISRLNHILADVALAPRIWHSKGFTWYGELSHPDATHQQMQPDRWYRIDTFNEHSRLGEDREWTHDLDYWRSEAARFNQRA